jgi:hypothetical protein
MNLLMSNRHNATSSDGEESICTDQVSCAPLSHARDRMVERNVTCEQIQFTKKYGKINLQFHDGENGKDDAILWSEYLFDFQEGHVAVKFNRNQKAKPARYELHLDHQPLTAMKIKKWLQYKGFFEKKTNRISFFDAYTNTEVIEGRTDSGDDIKIITVVIRRSALDNTYHFENSDPDSVQLFENLRPASVNCDVYLVMDRMRNLLMKKKKKMEHASAAEIFYQSECQDGACVCVLVGKESARRLAWKLVQSEINQNLVYEVGRDGMKLRELWDEHKSSFDIVLAAVKSCPDAIDFASKELQANLEVLLYAPSKFGDIKFMTAAVNQNGDALKLASPALKSNEDLVVRAAEQKGSALRHACPSLLKNIPALFSKSDSLRENSDFLLVALAHDNSIMGFLSDSLKSDKKFVLAALKENRNVYEYLQSSDMGNDRDVALHFVTLYPDRFRILRPRLKLDEEIARIAINSDFKSIQFVLDAAKEIGLDMNKLKEFKRLMITAVQVNGNALKLLPEMFRDDKDMVSIAVKERGNLLFDASWRLQRDLEVIEIASESLNEVSMLKVVQMNGNALQFARIAYRNDPQFVLHAVLQIGTALRFATEKVKNDRAVVIEAVKNSGLAINYASEKLKNDEEIKTLASQERGFQIEENRSRQLMGSDVAMKDATTEQRNDRNHILGVVDANGLNLSGASLNLRGDPIVVRKALEQTGNALEFASEALRDNEDLVLLAIKSGDSKVLKFASERLKNQSRIVLKAIRNFSKPLAYASPALKSCKTFALAAVQENGKTLEYFKLFQEDVDVTLAAVHTDKDANEFVSKSLKRSSSILITEDTEFMLEAVRDNGLRLKFASEKVKYNEQVVFQAIDTDALAVEFIPKSLVPCVLNHVSDTYKSNKDFMLYAIEKDPESMRHVAMGLKVLRSFVLEALQRNGLALQFCLDPFKEDEEIVKCASLQNPSSVAHASVSLKTNHSFLSTFTSDFRTSKDFFNSILKQNGHALQYASYELKIDPDIVKAAVIQDGLALQHASKDLCQDPNYPEIVFAAQQNNGDSLEYASDDYIRNTEDCLSLISPSLKRKKEFMLRVVRQRGQALALASPELTCDACVAAAAVRENPNALEFACASLRNDASFVLAAVKQCQRSMQHASDQLKQDKHFWEMVLSNLSNRRDDVSEGVFSFVPSALRSDQTLFAKICHYEGRALQFASIDLKKMRSIAMTAVLQNGDALQYVADDLKGDETLVLAAISYYPDAILYASEALQEDREFVLKLVQTNGLALKNAKELFKSDPEVVLIAVNQNNAAAPYVSPSIKRDPTISITLDCAFMFDAVTKNGLLLAHGSELIKQTKNIVLAAVKQNGTSLRHAAAILQADLDVVRTAVTQNGEALQFAHTTLRKRGDLLILSELSRIKHNGPQNSDELLHFRMAFMSQYPNLIPKSESLMQDKKFMLEVVQYCPCFLQYASEPLRGDKDLVSFAIKINGEALQYASESLKDDRDLVYAAIEQNGSFLEHASEKLKGERAIVLFAVQKTGLSLKHASCIYLKDEEIVFEAIKQDAKAATLLSKKNLKKLGQTFIARILQSHGDSLQYFHVGIKNNRDLVLEACKSSEYNALRHASNELKSDLSLLCNAPDTLKDNKAFMLEAVTFNGHALGCASQILRNDADLVLAAVKQSVSALEYSLIVLGGSLDFYISALKINKDTREYVVKSIQSDKDLILRLLQVDGLALKFVGVELQDNLDFVIVAVGHDGNALEFASERLRAEESVVTIATNQNAEAYIFADIAWEEKHFLSIPRIPCSLRDNKTFMLRVVQNRGSLLQYASTELRSDRNIARYAVINDGSALGFVPEHLKRDAKIVKALAQHLSGENLEPQ